MTSKDLRPRIVRARKNIIWLPRFSDPTHKKIQGITNQRGARLGWYEGFCTKAVKVDPTARAGWKPLEISCIRRMPVKVSKKKMYEDTEIR
jgi:hypothetical protein